jgi:MFS family permease
MEILLLSFLAVVLKAEWNLTEKETDSITSSVFLGALIGTLTLGTLGDHIGRKPVFTLTASIISVFGLATATANSLVGLILCRCMVGFGVGGLTVPFDTLAEFIPTSHRGNNLLLIEFFWSSGSLLVPALAYLTLGREHPPVQGDDEPTAWRSFVFWCSVPCLLSTVLGLMYVPESPRWLLAEGRQEEALAIMRHAAFVNGRNLSELFPAGTVLTGEDDEEEEEEANNCWDLLSSHWRQTTLLLWTTFAGFSFIGYGTVILVTLVFSNATDDKSSSDAAAFDYGAIFMSASSDLAGTTLIIYLVDRVGRIASQATCYFCGGICIFVLCMLAAKGNSSRSIMIVAAFTGRMFFMSGSCASWVSCAEILTTEIRTTGHSAANAAAKISGTLTPYVITSTTPFAVQGWLILLVSCMTSIVSWNLPETSGRSLGSARRVRHQREDGAGADHSHGLT